METEGEHLLNIPLGQFYEPSLKVQIEMAILRVKRRANGPAHQDRMVMLRKEIDDLERVWHRFVREEAHVG